VAPRGERQRDIPPRIDAGRWSYEDLNQKNNATEGRKPGIDGRRIGEENRFYGQLIEWDEGNDKCSKRENVNLWQWIFRLDQWLVRPVVFADHRDVRARTFPGFQDIDALLGYRPMLWTMACLGTMVVTGRLYRHMAIGPKAKDKNRRLAMAQAKMTEHCNEEPQAKPFS
jgi:hypothetical protein